MDIQKNTQAVLANSISKKEGTECSFPLFVKTQNSNFHKSSKISDHNLETEIAEDRCQCNQDLLVRNKYLKARLLQTEKIGLVFTEELDAMMSLFIKKNENEIIRNLFFPPLAALLQILSDFQVNVSGGGREQRKGKEMNRIRNKKNLIRKKKGVCKK